MLMRMKTAINRRIKGWPLLLRDMKRRRKPSLSKSNGKKTNKGKLELPLVCRPQRNRRTMISC
jgi:hypothetical protein